MGSGEISCLYQWKILIYVTYNEMNETTKFNSHMCHDQRKTTTYVFYIEKDETTNFCLTRVMIQDKTHLYFTLKMDENLKFTSHQS